MTAESEVSAFGTLVDALRARAQNDPAAPVLTWVLNGEEDGPTLTLGQLDQAARRIACAILTTARPGDRVLLVYPPGPDFAMALWGCLYAGVIPTPAYPPDPLRLARTAPRLSAIAKDAQVDLTLSIDALCAQRELLAPYGERFRTMTWLGTDVVPEDYASAWRPPVITPDSIALLQYSSGSTGDPKGILATHANIAQNLNLIARVRGDSRHTRSAGWVPQYHDLCLIGGLLSSVWVGFQFWAFSPIDFLQRPARWLELASRVRATMTAAPNFAFDLAVRKTSPAEIARLDLSSIECLVTAAEPVRAESVRRFLDTFGPCGLRPEALRAYYGLAENTLFVSGNVAGTTFTRFDRVALDQNRAEPVTTDDPADAVLPAYPPCPEQRVVIVDPDTRRRVPDGHVGEIWIGGPSVCAGYFDRPGASIETFRARTADTFDGPFLRSGDLGFQRDGLLYLTGRRKDLVIIRGRNVWPQDLEAVAESSHPAIRPGSSAAFAIPGPDGEETLVMVAETSTTDPATLDAVGAAIRGALAATFDVAVRTVVLIERGTLPKTSSGKVQRAATRAAHLAGQLSVVTASVSAAATPPRPNADASGPPPPAAARDPRTQAIAAWLGSEIAIELRLDDHRIAGDLPLVQIGLDSLAAVTLQHRIESRFQHTLDIAALLGGATINGIARQLANGIKTPASPSAAVPATVPVLPLGEHATASDAPTSSGQKALWFLHQLAPTSAAYHIAAAGRVQGPFDFSALERALQALAARHPTLRTRFPLHDGLPVQRIDAATTVDIRLTPADAAETLDPSAFVQREARLPFDLEHGPLWRVRVLQSSPTDQVVLFVAHHIVVDHDALAMLAPELWALYEAARQHRPVDLPAPPSDMAAFANWQTSFLASTDGEELAAWWMEQFQDPPPPLDLPLDGPRPPAPRFIGASHTLHLDAALSAAAREAARAHGVTLSALLLATYATLLARLSGQDDFTIGCPTNGRNRREWAQSIGFLSNTLAVRLRLDHGTTFADTLQQVHQTLLGALAHQDYPFPQLVQRLRLPRDAARSPLFGVLYNALPHSPVAATAVGEGTAAFEIEGRRLTGLPVARGAAQFDVSLTVADDGAAILASFEYDTDLFEAATIAAIADQFRCLLGAVLADPTRPLGHLPLRDEASPPLPPAHGPVLHDGRPFRSLHTRFAEMASQRSDAVAVRAVDGTLTYRALDERANALAEQLRHLGIGPGAVVGVLLDRTLHLPVALLGILKSGAAYLPLDPQHPRARLDAALDDAQARAVVTSGQRSVAFGLADHARPLLAIDAPTLLYGTEAPPEIPVGSDDVAYVIFTSGSTGRPKGVAVPHGALVNFLDAMRREPGMTAHDILLAVTTVSFDIAALELFLPLLVGGQVVIADAHTAADGQALRDALLTSAATVLQATPATWRMLLDAGWHPQPHLRMFCGGEALSRDVADALLDGGGALWNLYGPTEATVWCTAFNVVPDVGPVSIGHPIDNTVAYVLDAAGQRVPANVPGELYVGGACVAHGYVGRPELTAERFVPDPFATDPRARLYRTGDIVRARRDGRLECLGRADQQIKLRGFRIEPGDIEVTLRAQPAIRDAVVVLRRDQPGQAHLIGYVTLRDPATDLEALRRSLHDLLPPYMVPSMLMALEALPETGNRKLDRGALPVPLWQDRRTDAAAVPPSTDLEQALCHIWATVLGHDAVSITDDFFILGGDSLAAVRLCTAVGERLGLRIAVQFLLDHPTVQSAARALEAQAVLAPDGAPAAADRPLPSPSPRQAFITTTAVPLLKQLQAGNVAAVDAVALAAIPTDLPRQLGIDPRSAIAELCRDQPLWARTFDTSFGRIGMIFLPRYEAQLHHDPHALVREVQQASRLAHEIGAQVVSLTGLLASATGYGQELLDHWEGERSVTITTGHATTAAGVALTLRAALLAVGRSLANERVAVLGLGSIGRSTLTLVLGDDAPAELVLCDLFGQEARLMAIADGLRSETPYRGPIRIVASRGTVPQAVYDATVIIVAASVPGVLDPARLRTGVIVVDDGFPPGCDPSAAWERVERSGDVLVLSAGALRAPFPIAETRYLPAVAGATILNDYGTNDPRDIGSCVLSSLLSERYPAATPTIGIASPAVCRAHLTTVLSLGFEASHLRLGLRPYQPEQIERFRDEQASAGAAVRTVLPSDPA